MALTIDHNRREVRRDGELLPPLTPTEWQVLSVLATRPVSFHTAQQLMAHANFDRRDAQMNAKVYIRRLRVKIEPDASRPVYIVNRPGHGYMLDGDVRQVSPRAAA